MKYGIFNELNKYLSDRNYLRVKTDSDQVRMYAVYQKSSLYLFNVIRINEDYVFDKEKYDIYRAITKVQFNSSAVDSIILLNLIVTPNPDNLYKHLNFTPELDDKFIDIHWLIDSNNRELIIPSKQINSVLGMEKDIRKILDENTTTYYDIKKQYESTNITYGIVMLNVLVWFFLELKGGSTNPNILMEYGALNLKYVQAGDYWRIFTSIFMHIGLTHLLFNCFSLVIFGSRLEKYLKGWQFVTIYLVSGIAGSLFSLGGSALVEANIVSAGASGAIYGLIGSILICSKAMGQPLEGLTSYTMWLIFIAGIIYSVTSPNVDAFAHIGGFVGGILMTMPFISLSKKTYSSIDE